MKTEGLVRKQMRLFPLVGVLLLITVSSASAATLPEKLFQVPRPDRDANSGGAGRLDLPTGIGVSSTSGHIFVAEAENARISEFTSWGAFVRAWGWGVATGAAALETCGPSEPQLLPDADLCREGLAGSGPGQFANPGGIAVDGAGFVYVYDFRPGLSSHARVEKFSPTGDLVWLVGGEVNKTDKTNVCTASDLEEGDQCGGGTLGTGDGEFSNGSGGNFVAVGPNETLYVGDAGRIQEFTLGGVFKGELKLQGELAGKTVRCLSVDAGGNLFLVLAGENQVRKLSSLGEVLAISFVVTEPLAISVDREGHLYVVHDPLFLGKPRIVEFAPDGSTSISPEDQFRFTPDGQEFRSNGIGTNVLGDSIPNSEKAGDIYVGAYSNVEEENRSYVAVFGPEPAFEPAPPAPPSIEAQYGVTVGTQSATVGAEINPHFFSGTTYYVEYGTGKCSEGGCTTKVPTPPGSPLGAGKDVPAATSGISLTGLQSDTTYYYRFVAVSGSFTTVGLGEGENGGEATFTTARGPGFLPDERAYEMISPALKNNAELRSAIPGLSVAPTHSSPNGSSVTYASVTAFGPDPESAPAASQYLSRRGAAGWATQNITPRDEESYLTDPIRAFSEDLSKAAVVVLEPPLTFDAPIGYENLYSMDVATEALQLVTPTMPPDIDIKRLQYCVDYQGSSQDFSRIFFAANGALTPEAPKPGSAEQVNLYEWSVASGVRLVSKLPNGTPVPPENIRGFGSNFACRGTPKEFLLRAISADGTKAFWGSLSALYARVSGTSTVQLDLKQGGPGPSGGGIFRAASEDGSKIFFTDPNKLTSAGTASNNPGDLYRYNFGKPLGSRVEDLTPNSEGRGVLGVLGASENGSIAYFASQAVLSGNEGPAGGTAAVGKPNLYLWEEGDGVSFIGTLQNNAQDSLNWSLDTAEQTARATADGDHLAFVSTAPLTDFDNTDQKTGKPDAEVFLYDAKAEELRCTSCRASGARPAGSATLPRWSTPFEQPRYLSDDGERLFFETADALDVEDINGLTDVYEFELAGKGTCTEASDTFDPTNDGCVYLISSGKSVDISNFLDASTTGDDVFFTTRQQLVGRDIDERVDVYDARVGGFEPPLPPEPEPCSDVAECLGQAPAPPAATSPGTDAEPGNLKPKKIAKKCRKGTHKVKKKGKVRCVKNKKKHHSKAGQSRRAAR